MSTIGAGLRRTAHPDRQGRPGTRPGGEDPQFLGRRAVGSELHQSPLLGVQPKEDDDDDDRAWQAFNARLFEQGKRVQYHIARQIGWPASGQTHEQDIDKARIDRDKWQAENAEMRKQMAKTDTLIASIKASNDAIDKKAARNNGAPQRERAMIALAAFQGLRAGEIAGLQREDILDLNVPPVLIVTEGKAGISARCRCTPRGGR